MMVIFAILGFVWLIAPVNILRGGFKGSTQNVFLFFIENPY